MLNEEARRAIDAARLNAHFGKPLYDSYCFSRIPQTIIHLLTGDGDRGLPASTLAGLPDRYDKVILLFIDAFGWRFFEQYQDQYPFLRRFVAEGVVSKLTSQFPSTTAAHVTTINTGLPVGESGVYEWFYYEPLVDSIIAPLPFSFAGDRAAGTLAPTGVSPQSLYPQQTIYQTLAQHGVKSFAFQSRDFTPAPYSDVVLKGAKVRPYKTISEALVNLSRAAIEEPGKAYYFLYFDSIDSTCHVYGPGSEQFEAEVDTFLNVAERLLTEKLAGKLKNTLLLLTADHGQVNVSPDTTIYLNRLTPSIEPFIKVNGRGQLLVPAGSPRDLFLHIKDEHLEEARILLTEQLAGRAEVWRVQDLIDQGFFGSGAPSPVFLNRVGNLIILPYDHESVWWYEKGRFEQRFYGHHGGLVPGEMETLLLALAY